MPKIVNNPKLAASINHLELVARQKKQVVFFFGDDDFAAKCSSLIVEAALNAD